MVNNDKINIGSRKARLQDFLDSNEEYQEKGNKYNNNNNNKDRVQKNQQEFGQKKRIKP